MEEEDLHDAGQEDNGKFQALAALDAHQIPDHLLRKEKDGEISKQVNSSRCHGDDANL